MATLAGVRTAPLAIPAYRRREAELGAAAPGAPSSPDLLFSMSPEPEPGFHTRMIQQQGLGSSAALARDPSLEALFARPSPVRARTSVTPASRSPLGVGVAVRPSAARSISALPQEEQPWLYSFPTPTATGVSLPYHPHAYRSARPVTDVAASPPMVVRSHPRRFERAGGTGHPAAAHPGPPARSVSSSSSASAASSGFSSPPRDSSAASSVATSRDLSPPTPDKHSSAETVSRLCDAFTHGVRLNLASRHQSDEPGAKRRPMHSQALLAGSPAAPRVSMDFAISYKPDEGLMRKTPGSPLAACIDPMQTRGRRRPAVR